MPRAPGPKRPPSSPLPFKAPGFVPVPFPAAPRKGPASLSSLAVVREDARLTSEGYYSAEEIEATPLECPYSWDQCLAGPSALPPLYICPVTGMEGHWCDPQTGVVVNSKEAKWVLDVLPEWAIKEIK